MTTTYEIAYWYSTRDTVTIDADSPEEAERLAAETLGMGEDEHLEEWRVEGEYDADAVYTPIDDREWQGASGPEVEIDLDGGLVSVRAKSAGVQLVIRDYDAMDADRPPADLPPSEVVWQDDEGRDYERGLWAAGTVVANFAHFVPGEDRA